MMRRIRHRPILFMAGLLGFSMLCLGCAGTKDTGGHTLGVDRSDVLSWNPCNTWEKISSHPDTYIPIGMVKGAPVDEAHGQWVVDPQDHSRFYVPHGGLKGTPESFFAEQARIATKHPAGALLPLIFLLDMVGAVANSGH